MITEILLTLWHKKGENMAVTANVVNGQLDSKYTTPKSSTKETTAKGANLDYDDFLQLLCAEMQYQDPLEPTSNTDYVAQLATFSQLEATLSMKDSLSSSYTEDQKSAALALVGKEVVVVDKTSDSGYTSGEVDFVTYEDGEIKLSINDKTYSYSDLYSVSTDKYYDAIVNSGTFKGLISSLPKVDDVTLDTKENIEKARNLYDGLTDYEKQFISKDDYSKLIIYEDKIKSLEESDDSSDKTDGNGTDTADSDGTDSDTTGTNTNTTV